MIKSYDIKVFQIDRNQFEIRDKDVPNTIIEIIKQHKNRLGITDSNTLNYVKNSSRYWSYVFNEDIKKSYWESFLPYELSYGHDFDIKQISFVLFCNVSNNIFAVVGGSGIRVIKKFLNDRFGIDLFERFMNLNDDVVISHISRGILGSLSENRKVYRNDKYLNEAFDITDVPTKILVKLREEIKDSLFDFIQFNSKTSVLEVGSYFYLKVRLTFDLLHKLFNQLSYILSQNKINNLTSFIKIEDQNLISDNLEINLFGLIFDDYANKFGPNSYGQIFAEKDIDFVHPTNLIGFYECDTYEIKVSHLKKTIKVFDRQLLYYECLKMTFSRIGIPNSLIDFIKFLRRITVIGYRNKEQKTSARFFDHITAEVQYNNQPYFKVDNLWYEVRDEFINNINSLCIEYYSKYLFRENHILKKWIDNITEGDYNDDYRFEANFYVFDKVLTDNIELCDLLYIDNVHKNIHLIHVKDGFDAKMRDLYNQVILSSQRLQSDLKSSNKSSYLKNQIECFNNVQLNAKNGISLNYDDLYKKITEDRYVVNFVMAFKSKKNPKLGSFDTRVASLKSNIAKYALVQTVKEIDGFHFYTIDLADL